MRQPTQSTALVRAPVLFLAVVAGVLAAEMLLRLVLPVEIRFETWFTPGIHQYDPQLGFVCSPGYKGLMRHPDQLYRGVPLELDAKGFRMENRTPGADNSAARVVLLGGRSAAMCYGLPDDATLTAVLARNTVRPLRIQNSAWAGWGLWMNWLTYRRELDDGAPYDLAIVAIYEEPHAGYEPYTTYEWAWPAPSESEVFAQIPGIRLWPSGNVARAGAWPYRSYLLYGLLRAGDALTGVPPEHPPATDPRPADGFIRYLTHIRDHLATRGTRTLFVFLPRKDAPADVYDPIASAMPEDFPSVNLHRQLHGQMDHLGWIADDHYSTALAQAIGEALAQPVDAMLDGEKEGENVGL